MISNNQSTLEANKQIKINAKGKFLGTVMGDYSGAPAESYTWRHGPNTENKKIIKNNLKMCPLFKNEPEDYRYVVRHPAYSKDDTKFNKFLYHCIYENKDKMHVTDDTFFSGEGVNTGLPIFCSENANKTDINEKCRQFYNQYTKNLRQFASYKENSSIVQECGPGTQCFLLGCETVGSVDRDGSVMRIGQVALFADSLPDLNKIVLAAIRNTHYHQYSFDAARSVAGVVYMTCCGLSQKSIANYIAFEFARRYTKKPPIIYKDEENKRPSDYGNGDKFFDFKMYDTVRKVYKDRTDYNYTETALDNVVVALRIICVAGSFLEAWRLTKAYAADSDTLQAIVLSMAAFMFGIPEEFQEEARTILKSHKSQDIKGYETTSDELDNKCSNRYRENAPLEEQLKKTLEMLKDIENNKSRDMVDINNEIGFNDGKQPFHNYKTVKEEDLKVDCQEFKNLIKSICDDWNFNLSLDAHYDRNQRKLYEYEPDSKLPENAPKNVLEKYREAEEKFYDEVNQHNSVTAEFQDKVKMDKLKALTPEKIKEMNKLIDEINQIAKRYQVKVEIKKLPPRDLQPCQQTILSITKAESGQQTVALSQAESDANKKHTQEIIKDSSGQSEQVQNLHQTQIKNTENNGLAAESSSTTELNANNQSESFESQNNNEVGNTKNSNFAIDSKKAEAKTAKKETQAVTGYSPNQHECFLSFWNNKRKTTILVFMVVPAASIIIVFCFLPFGIGATTSGGIALLDLFAFWLTSKLYNYLSKPTNTTVSQVNGPELVDFKTPNEKDKKIRCNQEKLQIVPIREDADENINK